MAQEHYSQVKEYSLTPAGMAFRKMLNECINNLRIKNDDTEDVEFYRNQGAIRELKKIIKGISPVEKEIGHNGAFDE